MTEPRKLIFYSTIGPDRDTAAWTPFTFAKRALDASLEAEIFLAGPATGLLRHEARTRIEGRQKEALDRVLEAKIPIHFSPG